MLFFKNNGKVDIYYILFVCFVVVVAYLLALFFFLGRFIGVIEPGVVAIALCVCFLWFDFMVSLSRSIAHSPASFFARDF